MLPASPLAMAESLVVGQSTLESTPASIDGTYLTFGEPFYSLDDPSKFPLSKDFEALNTPSHSSDSGAKRGGRGDLAQRLDAQIGRAHV